MYSGSTNGAQTLANLGISGDIADTLLESEEYPIFPENWKPLHLYLRCKTQWRVGGMGAFIGLDYNTLFPVMDLMEIPTSDRLETLDCVRTIENTARAELNRGEK